MLNNLNLHQSVLHKCSLQFVADVAAKKIPALTSDCFFKETWRHALYHFAFCYPFLIRQPACVGALLFFLCNSRNRATIFPCLLNCIFPSFDIIALAAWMNSNGGGDFSSNYEVDFPDDLHYYSIVLYSMLQNRGYNSWIIVIVGGDNIS